MSKMTVTGVNHVTLAVKDLDRSFTFYRDVLGLRPKAKWSKGAYLSGGSLWLALIVDPNREPGPSSDYSHVALSVTAETFNTARAAILNAGVPTWSENRSEGASHYFCDPDGHQLEIHVGDLDSRLSTMRKTPWESIEFFDPPSR